MTVPATARLMPVRIARKIRGSRNPTTISSACGFVGVGMVNGMASYHAAMGGRYACRKSCRVTAEECPMARMVSCGVMETVPIPAYRTAVAMTRSERPVIRAIRRALPSL
jgi:hypothetical protein